MVVGAVAGVKIVAVIPCYNEQETVGEVVRGARPFVDEVIVVDNRSSDGTAKEAAQAGATVAWCPCPGAGAATRKGLILALSRRPAAVVTLDGDGQHAPEEIPRIIAPILAGTADVVVGARSRSEAMPGIRRLGNVLLTGLTNAGAAGSIADSQCGFRAFGAQVLGRLDIETDTFGFCSEVVIKCRALGLRLVSVPVSTAYGRDYYKHSLYAQLGRGVAVPKDIIKWRWKAEWLPGIRRAVRRKTAWWPWSLPQS